MSPNNKNGCPISERVSPARCGRIKSVDLIRPTTRMGAPSFAFFAKGGRIKSPVLNQTEDLMTNNL